jgi:uncharacterized repeat protein (TIGR03803 family)
MHTSRPILRALLPIIVLSIVLSVSLSIQAQTLSTLYTFSGGTNGANPVGRLVFDKSGNLYGATVSGGIVSSACPSGCGTVFELSPNGSGGWSQTVLYTFTNENGSGSGPFGVTMDASGNLFGTAVVGGHSQNTQCGDDGGCGMVFELSPGASGWTENVLYSFQGYPTDGQYPSGNIVIDQAGNLYGTTQLGGIGTQQCYASGCGTVWELSPTASGSWKEKVIHNFLGMSYGDDPGGLVMDAAGNLYGATRYGGFGQRGTVYRLSPTTNGWIGGVIFRLSGILGYFPGSFVALSRQGNIFVSAENGSSGNIVELTAGAGGWTGQVAASFPENILLGPGLTTDVHGNIYGTTTSTLFELETVNGAMQIVTLATMDGANEGTDPLLPIFDAKGNLYGVDVVGQGTAANGTVFEITP